jgi:hypothetical protein
MFSFFHRLWKMEYQHVIACVTFRGIEFQLYLLIYWTKFERKDLKSSSCDLFSAMFRGTELHVVPIILDQIETYFKGTEMKFMWYSYFTLLKLLCTRLVSFPDVRSAGSTNLWKRLNRTTFLACKHVVFCTHCTWISWSCAQLKLDDSAEFQIVPTISNQISISYNINLCRFKARMALVRCNWIFQSSRIANLQIKDHPQNACGWF